MNKVRKPTVSGMFYEHEKASLEKQIESCFVSSHGPGNISKKEKKSRQLKGVIVPHAGYVYSGGTAAYSYNAIIEHGLADVYIILGPNHSHIGSGVAMATGGYWQTPLGNTAVDETIVAKLTGGIIDADDATLNTRENSIEVQLPFLQFISKHQPFSIVPIAIAMQDYDTTYDIGCQLADVIKQDKRKILMIASTDFSHEGISYGKIPPTEKVNDFVEQQDKHAILQIEHLHPKELIDTVYHKNISMCGFGPVAAMIVASKKLGASSAALLKYSTSYDVYPDSNACVGYASFAIF